MTAANQLRGPLGRWQRRRFPVVRVVRRPSETIVSFRETDLIGTIVTIIIGIPAMAGLFIWGHVMGWYLTALIALVLATLHTRIRIGADVRSERRILGIPFQRRRWSRSLQMTWWDDWDLMCPFVLTLDDGGEPFDLHVSEARGEMIREEVQRAIRRHAQHVGYRGP